MDTNTLKALKEQNRKYTNGYITYYRALTIICEAVRDMPINTLDQRIARMEKHQRLYQMIEDALQYKD